VGKENKSGPAVLAAIMANQQQHQPQNQSEKGITKKLDKSIL